MLSVICSSSISHSSPAGGLKRDGRPSPSPPHKHTLEENFHVPILIGNVQIFFLKEMLKFPHFLPGN